MPHCKDIPPELCKAVHETTLYCPFDGKELVEVLEQRHHLKNNYFSFRECKCGYGWYVKYDAIERDYTLSLT